ncbi:diketogulonate reductase-like aldo/keto reductase [Aneurinibacillus soli]|uniref:Glyoxal reductase n=1 Tax=Aneurinibacillus soli TaxID=1500254 RepID=A0A0U5B4R0_9BACL|nr:aldo/keto reductase [Aneurinibacillus soli]PYE61727.1 diketogulonate reductase-like aldo/keto reductase [Aneurinibacillus soli]BAU28415.1 Glyoxal reductase [Aneurinibacillus soli]
MTATSLTEGVTLQNGVKMPQLGLGVWRAKDGEEVERAVQSAIENGYRSIDTAAVYKNEEGVGRALARSGVPREDLFITTKVWNSDQGYDSTLAAFEESRTKLGLDYIDLYLIHWPVAGKYKETWRALETLYRDGKVRAIGVSNFQVHHLKDLIADSTIIPMVNQVEFHPLLTQEDMRAYCREHSIQLEAWSPLMQGNLDHPVLTELAAAYGKSPAQIILRWDLQHGIVTIPKSVTPSRIAENANVFDFELKADDMAKLDALNENRRFGPDPDNFAF